jgi:hypothetical protein
MRKGEYGPWEKAHGFASDRFLKDEASRFGECEIKKRPTKQI